MDLQSAYVQPDGEERCFDIDEALPSLPLPKLNETLDRYFESVKPFADDHELANTRRLLDEFKSGMGLKLHAMLEEKAKTEKNWIETWWEKYAYMSARTPLLPYSSMIQPFSIQPIGLEESRATLLKNFSRIIRYNLDLWDLVRNEKLKPSRQPDGTPFSSNLWKRFFNTSRVPGEDFDQVDCHFKTVREGVCPSHLLFIAKGRIFTFDAFNPDGSLIDCQQIYQCFSYIQSTVANEPAENPVAVLSSDERTSWAKNRKHLMSLSDNNREIIKTIDTCSVHVALDDNEPCDFSESTQMTAAGDLQSKWADKCSILVAFKNGMYGCIGEHACYDGTISIAYDMYMQMAFAEKPEPDWNVASQYNVSVKEHVFDLDDHLRSEIRRREKDIDRVQRDVVILWSQFQDFGKEYLKSIKIHPDTFVQVALQLTYYRLYKQLVPTYETAITRNYYHGRTETLRACTTDTVQFVNTIEDPTKSQIEKVKSFRAAADRHNQLMKEARSGNGIDRYLFGLWCMAFDNHMEIPELFSDPLFAKSGGGGNFVLSTSTLGFSFNCGCVSPMLKDGYGVFYSITQNEIISLITSYRESPETSSSKFTAELYKTFRYLKHLIDNTTVAKI